MRPDAPRPDDRLARAEAALRNADVPDGPSEDAIARTLAALREAADRPEKPARTWRPTMIGMMKLAAAVVLAGAGLFYVGGLDTAGASSVFAEAAGRVRQARTLSYRMTVNVPGAPEPLVSRVYFLEPGVIRSEIEGGAVTIFDSSRNRGLALDPSTKSATIIDVEGERGQAGKRDADLIEGLRAMAEKEGQPVGRKEIGGVEARGFRVEVGGMEMTVWIDPEKSLPVRVESQFGAGESRATAVLTDFAIDPELDQAMFSLEPPAGYAVKTFKLVQASPEADVATYLKVYAERSGGTFPGRLDDFSSIAKLPRPAEEAEGPELERRVMQMAKAVAHILTFPHTLKGYGYRAEGVKLGDADKVVFWYPKKDSERFRALFGDLHAEDVPAERLPEGARP